MGAELRCPAWMVGQLGMNSSVLQGRSALGWPALVQVSELQQELVINSPAPLQLELESCQARLKQLQASCATKESTIKELRRRLEEHVR